MQLCLELFIWTKCHDIKDTTHCTLPLKNQGPDTKFIAR